MRWMMATLTLMLFPLATPLRAQVNVALEATRWETRLNEVRKPVAGGTTFDPGVPTEGLYRFNSWRATWWYTVIEDDMWTLKLGATAKIRDAKIQVVQGAKRESDSNVGFVPLAHVWAERRFIQGWSAIFDMDALAAPQGRAVDAAVMVRRQFTPAFFADLGYRLLEGGADNDELYTWVRLDGWRAGAGLRF